MGLLDWITGVDSANADAARAADAKLKELNNDLERRGIIPEGDAAVRNADINATGVDHYLQDPGSSTWGGFQEGLDQGAKNIRSAVGDGINTVVGTGLKIIPWQAYVGAAVFGGLWIYMNFFRKR